jgi:hypothetical protein
LVSGGINTMTTSNLIITGCELVASVLLIYGFTKEAAIIRWEQRTKRKIKRFIYNLIVKLEG